MTLKQELAILLALSPFLILMGFVKAPDLVAYWPYPVSISGDAESVAMIPIPELRP